jgi:hypothetical protein
MGERAPARPWYSSELRSTMLTDGEIDRQAGRVDAGACLPTWPALPLDLPERPIFALGSGSWVLTAGVEVSREQSRGGIVGLDRHAAYRCSLGVVHVRELLQESVRGRPRFGGERRGEKAGGGRKGMEREVCIMYVRGVEGRLWWWTRCNGRKGIAVQ